MRFNVSERFTPPLPVSGQRAASLVFVEVEWQQVRHVVAWLPAWQLGQDMAQVSIWLDVAGAAGQHQAVDDGAGFGAGDRI